MYGFDKNKYNQKKRLVELAENWNLYKRNITHIPANKQRLSL